MSERLNNLPIGGTLHVPRAELITLISNLEGGFHDFFRWRGLFNGTIALSAAGFYGSHNSDAQNETKCQRILFRL